MRLNAFLLSALPINTYQQDIDREYMWVSKVMLWTWGGGGGVGGSLLMETWFHTKKQMDQQMEMNDCSLRDEDGWTCERADKQSGHLVIFCHDYYERVLKDGPGGWEGQIEGAFKSSESLYYAIPKYCGRNLKNKSEHVPNMYWLDHKPVYVSLIKFYSTCSWVFLPVDG